MNDDLISRQDAIEELKKYIAVNRNPNHDARIWEEGMNCAVTVIGALPSAQPEITQKDVEQYCRKRCLTAITNDLFHEMSARFSAQPERKQVEIEYTAWNEELYGQSAICGNCGCTWQIGNNGEDNFCPNCGAQMIQEG